MKTCRETINSDTGSVALTESLECDEVLGVCRSVFENDEDCWIIDVISDGVVPMPLCSYRWLYHSRVSISRMSSENTTLEDVSMAIIVRWRVGLLR